MNTENLNWNAWEKGNQEACHATCRYTQLIIHVEDSLLSSQHVKYTVFHRFPIKYIIYYYGTLPYIYGCRQKYYESADSNNWRIFELFFVDQVHFHLI
jgi:hypothetical protein